jgi:hypothetical protein
LDGDRFDVFARKLSEAFFSRRGILQRLAAGAAGLALAGLGLTSTDAGKKRKKKDRCKKTFATCSGKQTCCSKRCCLNSGIPGKFCGPKGSTCCPTGGACPRGFPICCDPEIVESSCAEAGRPVCCPPTTVYPDGYSCLAGYECCDATAGYCCLLPGIAESSPKQSVPVALSRRLGA